MSEDTLERSLRLLNDALNSPQPHRNFNSPRTFSPFTTSTLHRLEITHKNGSVHTESPHEIKKLRRSELLDLSITLDPEEISKACNMSSINNSLVIDDGVIGRIDTDLENLYQLFQTSFQSFGSTHNIFDAVSNFIEITTNSIDALFKNRIALEDVGWLINERNTWRLVNSLYKDRSIKYDDFSDEMIVDYVHERSEKELQEYFYKTNRSIRENQIVLDWLERIARDEWKLYKRAEMGHFTDRTVAWENTLHTLQTGDAVAYRPSRDTITSLDPDAPQRQARPLHDIDHEDDRRLLHQVFLEIRCGRLDKAEEHCVHCGQHWRASTLEGWRLFHDPNYLPPYFNTKLPIEGNPHRDIWKLCAWRMCTDPQVCQEERAVMGALCGHLPSLLAEAASWEDLLWAELRVLVDIRVEQDIRDNSLRNYVDMPKEYWNNLKSLENIFLNVKSHEKGKLEGNRPLRIVQELIILDNIPELLNRCSTWVQEDCQIQFLRFLTHLVLVLRILGKSEPVHYGDNVLAAYVKALISERNTDAIAYYTSLLPEEKQIELFSTYMESVGENTEKAEILAAAEKYKLNIKAITEKVVQDIRNQRMKEDGDSSLVKETTEEDLRKISSLDWMVYYRNQRAEAIWECNALIRVFISEGKLPAARLAHNKIPEDSISLILKQYNIEVDEELYANFEKSPPKVKSALKEFLCYKAYLDAHDGFNHWFHQYHNTKPVKPLYPDGGDFTEMVTYEHRLEKYNEEYERWKANMDHITKNVQAQLNNIIMFPYNGWLVDDYDGDPVRKSHMEKLRTLCIPQEYASNLNSWLLLEVLEGTQSGNTVQILFSGPLTVILYTKEVFILLHRVLHDMDLHDEAMSLFVLLMSEQHKFYEVFTKQGLEDMLKKVVDTSFSLLPKSRNPFSSLPWPEKIRNERPHSPAWIFKNLPAPQLAEDDEELQEIPPKKKDDCANDLEIEERNEEDEDDDDDDGDIGDFTAEFDEEGSISRFSNY